MAYASGPHAKAYPCCNAKKTMCETDLDDLESLLGDAIDISKGGFDWNAKVQAQMWEVPFAHFIA